MFTHGHPHGGKVTECYKTKISLICDDNEIMKVCIWVSRNLPRCGLRRTKLLVCKHKPLLRASSNGQKWQSSANEMARLCVNFAPIVIGNCNIDMAKDEIDTVRSVEVISVGCGRHRMACMRAWCNRLLMLARARRNPWLHRGANIDTC